MLDKLFNKKKSPASSGKQPHSSVAISLDSLIKLHYQSKKLLLNSHYKARSSLSGDYASPFKGRGMDFDETRIYQPGDDIRNMDWRVTARTGQPHSKIFKEERERPVFFITDLGASMHFATRGAFKSVIAARATALLAWAAVDHGDRVGGIIFSEKRHVELPPKARQHGVLRLLKTLEKLDSHSDAESSPPPQRLAQALNRLRRIINPGSLIFILSDFYHFDEECRRHFSYLARHNDIAGILIRDNLEITPPPPGIYNISNGSSISILNTSNKMLQQKYQDFFQKKYERLEKIFRKQRARLIELSTHQDTLDELHKELMK